MRTLSASVTKEDIATYQTQGFIHYKNFFSKTEMTQLRIAIDNAVAENRDRILGAEQGGRYYGKESEKVFNQMINLWVDSPAAKEFTFSKRLAETGRCLSQAEHIRIYIDHAMVKPGGQESRQTNWHQDAPYWPMDPVNSFSAWIAVDDVTIENGCLHFIPGSHKFGPQEHIDLASDEDNIVAKMRVRGFDVSEPEAIELEAGGVTFHHSCNFHFAGPNQTNKPRRAFAVIYIPNNVRFTGVGENPAGSYAGLELGGPFEHPLHPIVAKQHYGDKED